LLTFSGKIYAQSYFNDPDEVVAIKTAVDMAFTNIDKTARITVMNIQAPTSEQTAFITGELLHLLNTRGYKVVDRINIEIIQYEQELQYSGNVDDDTAVGLGKYVGADLIVTGAVTSIGTAKRLRLEVISTETTEVKGTAAVTLSDSRMVTVIPSTPQVNRVTLFPNSTTVNKGETQQFMVAISGTSNISQNVTWKIMGATNRSTTISNTGLLTVSPNETAPTLLVTATSVADPSKGESVTVTIADDAPKVSRVDIQPISAQVSKGNTQQFTATVSGTNNPSQAVTWTVVGGKSSGTGIDAKGLLVVALNETANSLTVRATSVADRSKSGITTVTFQLPAATVTNITIIPTNTPVIKGHTRKFTATVIGTNDPPQTVTWELSGAMHSATMINSSGLLQIAAAETATALVVKATSTYDTQKIGTATVAVTNDTPSITSVTVFPDTVKVVKGTPQQFIATVHGVNDPSQAVSWTVSGGASSATGITSNGLLLVAVNETATSLTIRATSTVDRSKSGTSIVTYSLTPVTPTVTNITIIPTTATMEKGATNQFRATVFGDNNPSPFVTWELIGGVDSGTSISSSGYLQVASSETATTLLVTATSVADPTKSETATVTIKSSAMRITGVEVLPLTGSVTKGNTLLFRATVNGSNVPTQSVTWSVTGATSSGTAISASGLLLVAQNENSASLTVRATSTADPSMRGSATVTISSPRTAVTPPQPTTYKAPQGSAITPYYGSSYNAKSSGPRLIMYTGVGMSIRPINQTYSYSDSYSYDPVVMPGFSYQLGASVGIPSGSLLVFEPGIRFISKGISYEHEYYNYDYGYNYYYGTYTEDIRLNYMDFLLKTKFDVSLGNMVAFQPYIGFAYGFLTSAEQTISGMYGDSERLDVTQYCNDTMFGINTGIDLILADKFLLGFELDMDMHDIVKDAEDRNLILNYLFNIGVRF